MTLAHRYPNGKLRWKCDICGKDDFWDDNWWCYDLLDDDLGDDTPTVCSKKCKNIFKTKVKQGIIEVPKVVYRGYTSTQTGARKGY